MPLSHATDAELGVVADLINSAYRGDSSRQGWTYEADYLDGLRTDEPNLRKDLAAQPGAQLLVWRDEPAGPILGCVWIEPADDAAWYLGMLTVRPDLQDRKLGRELMAEAEAIAAGLGARRIRLTVVHIRDTLIAWYRRRGYEPTGEVKPFPYDSPLVGIPKRLDLTFTVLEKAL